MKSLLLHYGFNIMEYRVLESHEDYFIVLSLITGQTHKIERGDQDVISS